jgi:hypothetical protein
MVTILLSLLAFATVLVSAGTTWSENLVLADCGIGLGVNGGSTSREMMYYSAAAWGAPKYMKNVPWDGSYPWRTSGVSQTLPNGDTWKVYINNDVGDPKFAGWASHTYDQVVLTCWSRHLDGLFTLADGKKCSMAYICNHQSSVTPAPTPAPAPPPNPPPAPPSGPLGENATPGALKYQPAVDYDGTACYQTAAIDRAGHTNSGLELSDRSCRQWDDNNKCVRWGQLDVTECRNTNRISNSNTYVREKCTNDGWCAYLYAYYFEKDEGQGFASDHGHKHDWEHLWVWTKNGDANWLAWSAHGDWSVCKSDQAQWDSNHPKFLYASNMGTHAFRRAQKEDTPKNPLRKYLSTSLVSIEKMDESLRKVILQYEWKTAHPAFKDGDFERHYNTVWKQIVAYDRPIPPNPNPRPRPPQRWIKRGALN